MADGVPLALDIALFEQLCFLAQLGQASESVWVRPPSQCPMKLGGGGGRAVCVPETVLGGSDGMGSKNSFDLLNL